VTCLIFRCLQLPQAAGPPTFEELMLHLLSGQANARVFGLNLGDWSVLLGGSMLAALVLFLN